MTDACSDCGSTEDLQEHHTSYSPEKTVILCTDCHRDRHNGAGVGLPQGAQISQCEQVPLERPEGLMETGVVSSFFDLASSPLRLATLLMIRDETPLSVLTEDADVSRSGVQKHVKKLRNGNAVRQNPESDYPYQLTPIGELLADIAINHYTKVQTLQKRLSRAEEEACEELEDKLSGSVLEKAIRQRKWELVTGEEFDTSESDGGG